MRAAAAPGVPAPSGRRTAVQTAAAGAVKAAAVADAPPAVLTAFTPRPITSVLPLERFQLPSGAASASTAAGRTTEVLCAAVQRKGMRQATGCFATCISSLFNGCKLSTRQCTHSSELVALG